VLYVRRSEVGGGGRDGRRGVFRGASRPAAAHRADLLHVQLGTRPPAILLPATHHLHAVGRPLRHVGRALLSTYDLEVYHLEPRHSRRQCPPTPPTASMSNKSLAIAQMAAQFAQTKFRCRALFNTLFIIRP